MAWQGITNNVISLICGLQYVTYINAIFTPSNSVNNAFLYTSSNFVNIILFKKNTWANYKAIGGYTLNPSGYLGDIEKDIEYNLTFKINFPNNERYLGKQIVPIFLGFGDNIIPYIDSSNAFWNTGNDIIFWTDEHFQIFN